MYVINIYPISLIALFQGFTKLLIINIALLALLKCYKEESCDTHKIKETLAEKGKVQMQLKW